MSKRKSWRPWTRNVGTVIRGSADATERAAAIDATGVRSTPARRAGSAEGRGEGRHVLALAAEPVEEQHARHADRLDALWAPERARELRRVRHRQRLVLSGCGGGCGQDEGGDDREEEAPDHDR